MRLRELFVPCVLAVAAARPISAQLLGAPFRVNTYTAGNQFVPAAAYDGHGNAFVVWFSDYTSPTFIKGQRYDAGFSKAGAEFQVTYGSSIIYGTPPSLACDGAGRCIVVWSAFYAPLHPGVFGRRFDAGGADLGGEFRVDGPVFSSSNAPRVAAAPSGQFLVAWERDSSLYAQAYGSSGAPIGSEFRVNTFTDFASTQASVAGNGAGFVVAWTNNFEDGSEKGVSAQRYSLTGAAVGGEFLVPTTTFESQYHPSVAFDTKGGFVVAWSTYQPDGFSYSYQIHSQRFTSSGAPLGPEFQVSTLTTNRQTYPKVAPGANGGYLVTWINGFVADARARFFSSTGEESPPELSLPLHNDLAGDGSGGFVVVYGANDGSGTGIFAQRLATPPQPIGPERKVDASTSLVLGPLPRVAEDSKGRFVVVWTEVHGQYDSDVVARRFDARGNATGAPFRVNSTTDYHAGPDVAAQPGDGFVVAWSVFDNAYGTGNVLARRYDASGNPLSSEQRVNAGGGLNGGASVASSGTGGYVVAWVGPDGGSNGIFARRFSSAGTPLGSDLAVNTTTTGLQGAPSVASDGAGNFAVVWASQGQDGSDWGVYLRRFTSGGAALTGELLVNTVTGGAQTFPKVGMNASGDFVVAFESDAIDGDGTAIRAQRYSRTGAALGDQLTVNSFTTGSQRAAAVSVDAGGDFVILWNGPGDGDANGVFGQRHKKTGERIGVEFQVNSYTTLDQNSPAVVLGRSLVAAWQSQAQEPSAGVGVYERVFANPCGGDVDGNGTVDVADVFYLINVLFAGAPAPGCDGDVNGDGVLDVADVFYLINYLFAGGPPPV
jgi:hypothetical protein